MTAQERNDVIRALLRDLDRHSPGEMAHASRVAVYAAAVGCELDLDDDSLLTLRYSAELHDIGKARIDAALLRKIAPLSDAEVMALRQHGWHAKEVLSSFDFLRPSLVLIRHHHEKWNGFGYPDGLAGDRIPLGARVISVAEAFDAMTFGTGWREPLSEQEALAEVRSQAGRHFDPQVVIAFLKVQRVIQPIGM